MRFSLLRNAVVPFSERIILLAGDGGFSLQKARAPDISTGPDESPQLIGSRCGSCGATTFPVQQWCPRCSSGEMTELLVPRRGTLVRWRPPAFPPGAPF